VNSKEKSKVQRLIGRLKTERRKQAQKIDILCNDFIAAHRQFISGLGVISFAADFYESIAGVTDLQKLLCTAGRLIEDRFGGANVAFFLRRRNNFELHVFEAEKPIEMENKRLENCFTTEVVETISTSNKLCSLDDMFAMGLQGNPASFDKLSAFAVPINDGGSSPGFILIYRSGRRELAGEKLHSIVSIAPGLCRAIESCRALAPQLSSRK